MKKILISFPALDDVAALARKKFETFIAAEELSTEELIQKAQELQPEGLMVVLKQKFSAETLEKLPKSVKVIATSSVGYDHFDLKAAQARGIVMTNTPDVLTECTADTAMMLLLNACRRAREYQHIMEQGWGKKYSQGEMLGTKVSGKTLGIYGMGRIGQAVAARARGFGMKIIYHNRRQLGAADENGAKYFSSFEEMLLHCDFLSLNAPGTQETQHIMNGKTFGLLPRGAVFVNVARGSLVDEKALCAALDRGHLFAAGLDVFEKEPDFNQGLLKRERIFMTPHMGSATLETRNAMGFRALENIEAVLNGKPAPDAL